MAYQVTSEVPRGSLVYGGPGFLGGFGEVKAGLSALKIRLQPRLSFPF